MVRVLTIDDIRRITHQHGLQNCFAELTQALNDDFARWDEFEKTPRHATHFSHGVIELMPICDKEYYAFKYVNGHPYNPKNQKQTVTAVGMLSEIEHGYPLMISEMTVLTAIRTAVTSALAAQYLTRKSSRSMAMIGCGSQAEFQVLAMHVACGIDRIHYFDIDANAMKKFADNLAAFSLDLVAFDNTESAIADVDVITTATADKQRNKILRDDWVHDGVHINGVGGDCPGKSELGQTLLERCKIVVEYLPQTKIEGEIQNLTTQEIHAELWEVITGHKPGRENDKEVTLFDSVGFALEDYTILRYFYRLAEEYGIGDVMHLVPAIDDPKDLFGILCS